MLWCLFTVQVAVITAILLRLLVRRSTSNSEVITHVDEFVGHFCAGVCMLELGVVGSVFGIYSLSFMFITFVYLNIYFSYFMFSNLYGTPLTFIDLYYQNKKTSFSPLTLCTIITTQIAALLAGQAFAKFIWMFEDHSHVSALNVACTTAISHSHPWLYAAMAEGTGVFICSCVACLLPIKYLPLATASLSMVFYYYFSHVSGMFMNPVIPAAFSFRCKGHKSDFQHFMIYWLFPIIGEASGIELVSTARKVLERRSAKKVE